MSTCQKLNKYYLPIYKKNSILTLRCKKNNFLHDSYCIRSWLKSIIHPFDIYQSLLALILPSPASPRKAVIGNRRIPIPSGRYVRYVVAIKVLMACIPQSQRGARSLWRVNRFARSPYREGVLYSN